MLGRRLRQLVMALYAAAVLGCVAMVVGPAVNDAAIAANPGRALAHVTAVTRTRTLVEYQDHEGIYHAPDSGVLYPPGLREGQQVWVTYAKDDPDLVKVQGREWTLAIIPALSVLAVSTIIAAAAWWLVGRIRR